MKASKQRRKAARLIEMAGGPRASKHLRRRKSEQVAQSQGEPHAPRGTRVTVVRAEGGWLNCRLTGTLVDDHGLVLIDGGPDDIGRRVRCERRRDYVVQPEAVR